MVGDGGGGVAAGAPGRLAAGGVAETGDGDGPAGSAASGGVAAAFSSTGSETLGGGGEGEHAASAHNTTKVPSAQEAVRGLMR
jgi:hypothetical protein